MLLTKPYYIIPLTFERNFKVNTQHFTLFNLHVNMCCTSVFHIWLVDILLCDKLLKLLLILQLLFKWRNLLLLLQR